jgi:Family of unknown function (DUF6497)
MTIFRCRGAGVAALILMAAGHACAEDKPISVPSGQTITYVDTVQGAPGPEGLTVRFRFLAPAIARDGGTVAPDVAQEDMLVLCRTYALPRIANTGPQPAQVVISLSDRPVEFGVADEGATQFFDAFSIQDGDCILELF